MSLKLTFGLAQLQCKSFPGGDLVVDNNPNTNEALKLLSEYHTQYWIGLKDIVGNNIIGDYQWLATGQNVTTGSQFWYSSSYPIASKFQCVQGIKNGSNRFVWRDRDCKDFFYYICQRPINFTNLVSIYPTATSSLVSSLDLDHNTQSSFQLISSTPSYQNSVTATGIINELEFNFIF